MAAAVREMLRPIDRVITARCDCSAILAEGIFGVDNKAPWLAAQVSEPDILQGRVQG